MTGYGYETVSVAVIPYFYPTRTHTGIRYSVEFNKSPRLKMLSRVTLPATISRISGSHFFDRKWRNAEQTSRPVWKSRCSTGSDVVQKQCHFRLRTSVAKSAAKDPLKQIRGQNISHVQKALFCCLRNSQWLNVVRVRSWSSPMTNFSQINLTISFAVYVFW